MENQSPSLTTLLAHDGELADVRALFEELGLDFVERCGESPVADQEAHWDLVVATPGRMIEVPGGERRFEPIRIAILDERNAGLLWKLQTRGIELIVRRPVHPAALRLLILHSIYRGPERRGRIRVSVGAPIRVRLGWRRRSVVLADLSCHGCRLLSRQGVPSRKKITLQLPATLSGAKVLSLRGRVVRSEPSREGKETLHSLAVEFESLSRAVSDQLADAIARFSVGPAVYRAEDGDPLPLPRAPRANAPTLDLSVPEMQAEPEDPSRSEIRSAPQALPLPEIRPEPEELEKEADERRRDPRRAYTRRLVALEEEATRVLIGRDISPGGMRVDPNPMLHVGKELQIAVHLRARAEPAILTARVERDDGDRGHVLCFVGLSRQERDDLQQMMRVLPILSSGGEADQGDGVVVSQILEE